MHTIPDRFWVLQRCHPTAASLRSTIPASRSAFHSSSPGWISCRSLLGPVRRVLNVCYLVGPSRQSIDRLENAIFVRSGS